MERLQTSNVSISNGNIKYPIGKSIFAVNLPLKLFRTTVANADIGSLKSLHTLFDKYLDHMLVQFAQNWMVQTTRNFEVFVKKRGLKPFLTKRWRHFGRPFCSWNNCLMLNLISRPPSFQCAKNNGTAIRVTRLKVAPNTADPISIRDSRQ